MEKEFSFIFSELKFKEKIPVIIGVTRCNRILRTEIVMIFWIKSRCCCCMFELFELKKNFEKTNFIRNTYNFRSAGCIESVCSDHVSKPETELVYNIM